MVPNNIWNIKVYNYSMVKTELNGFKKFSFQHGLALLESKLDYMGRIFFQRLPLSLQNTNPPQAFKIQVKSWLNKNLFKPWTNFLEII